MSLGDNVKITIMNEPKSIQSSNDDIDWWPMFHHDLNRTGYTTSSGPETNNVLWSYQADIDVYPTSPAVIDYKVYIGGYEKYFICLNSETGEEIWKTHVPQGNVESCPTVVNGKLYYETYRGGIYCLNASTGDILWNYQNDNMSVSSPVVYNGKVYFGSASNSFDGVYCLDANDGEEIWISEEINSPQDVAIYDDRIYFGSSGLSSEEYNINCLNALNGEKIWVFQTDGGKNLLVNVALNDGRLYAGGDGLYCLDMNYGELIWKYPVEEDVPVTPCIAEGYVYFADEGDGNVYCLDVDSGEKIWEYDLHYHQHSSSPAYADGKIYIGSLGLKAKMHCIDALSGEKIWHFNTVSGVYSSPAVANGSLYVSLSREVLCFGGHSDNQAPVTPKDIFGPRNAKLNIEYTYNTTTYDPDGDLLYYKWDWATGRTGWLGPYESNETVEVKITFPLNMDYFINVIVKDSNHARSEWSTINVNTPRTRTSHWMQFLDMFPVLQRILQLWK